MTFLMPLILLETKIKSSIEVCFDLSRSVDLHQISTVKSEEVAIDGKTQGLLDLGDWVTWEANHFGVRQRLTSKITALDKYNYFQDTMMKGAFNGFCHDHFFENQSDYIVMTDRFIFDSPLGFLGRFFNMLVLTRYMRKLLVDRNMVIKHFAETEKWKSILHA